METDGPARGANWAEEMRELAHAPIPPVCSYLRWVGTKRHHNSQKVEVRRPAETLRLLAARPEPKQGNCGCLLPFAWERHKRPNDTSAFPPQPFSVFQLGPVAPSLEGNATQHRRPSESPLPMEVLPLPPVSALLSGVTPDQFSATHPPLSKRPSREQRRRSEIVQHSLRGSVPIQLPNALFPNLPRPGLMPTRGGGRKTVPARSFAAAETQFRAKTIFFYKDGDEYFTGVRVPVSKARFRTMDALLDELNETIPLPFGARRLHTPTGRTPISSLEQLKPHGRYVVVSSTRRVRGVDLEAVEKRKRRREEAARRWNFQQPSAAASSSSIQLAQIRPRPASTSGGKSDDQMVRTHRSSGRREGDSKPAEKSPFLPITFKPVFFVLNGHPHRVYRALVNPQRKGQLDTLLEEVSQGLQSAIFRLYSFEGDRILDVEQLLQLKDMRAVAVPRHEQLMLNGVMHSDILRSPTRNPPSNPTFSSSLPPISKFASSSFSKSSRSSKSSSGGSNKAPNFNIDRQLPVAAQFGSFSSVKRRKKSPKEATMRERKRSQGNPPIGAKKVASHNNSADESATTSAVARPPTPNGMPKWSTASLPLNNRNNASASNTDSGRPRSALDTELTSGGGAKTESDVLLEEMAYEEENSGQREEEEEEEEHDEDYPEEPEELRALHLAERRREGITEEEEEEQEEEDQEPMEDVQQLGAEQLGHGAGQQDGEEAAEAEEVEQSGGLPPRQESCEEEQPVEKEQAKMEEQDAQTAAEDRVAVQIAIHLERKPSQDGPEQQQQLGVYSEELEQILYGDAAVKIQSVWRGYSTRKELKKLRFAEEPTFIINGRAEPAKKKKQKANNNYKQNDRHMAIVKRIKTPMAGDNSSLAEENPRKRELLNAENAQELDSSSDREDTTYGTELLDEKKALQWGMGGLDTGKSSLQRTPREDYPYTVTIITGNRWAADTEADLFVVLHGTGHDSEKLWLRQEFTNWLQSGSEKQHFRQNQSDSFSFHLPSRLGIIKRLTVGHECRGYGAGVFVDRILVTEDDEEDEQGDCRQFLFLCNKWLDSGQVDGKLERSVRLNAFYEIGSIPVDNRVTRGRWELVFHGGTEKGQGGTSSQLAVTGYGTGGQSTTAGLYDSRMAKAPSEALMQVDFGDIGELLKIRVEIDGNGAEPDYFLNFVEFKDLDTDEHFVVMCGKWLRWSSSVKGAQPFRELLAFHIGVEPLPLIAYDGKIHIQRSRLNLLSSSEVHLELHGDLGETGFIRVRLGDAKGEERATPEEGEQDENAEAKEWDHVSFKMEAVSVGRVSGARVYFDPNPMGEQIVEGLIALQGMFQRQSAWPLASNSDFLLSRIQLRESAHTPYRYILSRSQLTERAAQGENGSGGWALKEMLATEMEGMSTRLPKRKEAPRQNSNWLLQMSLSEGSTLLPDVVLCGELACVRMSPLDSAPSDGMLSFQLDSSAAAALDQFVKVRISTDGHTQLTGAEVPEEAYAREGEGTETQSQQEQEPFSLVAKVRICDTANGDELRFPAADCLLQRHSVFELPAIWPDRPPIPILIYGIRIVSGAAEPPVPPLTVRLNLFGELGDVGWRTLFGEEHHKGRGESAVRGEMAPFTPNTRNSFEFEAASVGELRAAEMEVRSSEPLFRWECREMVVTDANSAPFYAFRFPSHFSAECPLQRCEVLPFTDALAK